MNIELESATRIMAIRDKINATTGGTDASLSAAVNRVIAGYGQGDGTDLDAYWDAFQQNGTRANYAGCFAGAWWTNNTFRPKYPVTLKGSTVADYMFTYCNRTRNDSVDDLLDFAEFNSMFDFSESTRLQYTFYNARIKNLYVDCSSASTMTSTFDADNGGFVENLTLKVTSKTTSFVSTFKNQIHTTSITFTDDSAISANISFNLCSKLTKASITSIINALSSSTSGKTLTLSKTAKEAAFTTDEWTSLVATKSNWTISLV